MPSKDISGFIEANKRFLALILDLIRASILIYVARCVARGENAKGVCRRNYGVERPVTTPYGDEIHGAI